MTFLRRTNALSLILLLAMISGVIYFKNVSTYSIFISFPVLLVGFILTILACIPPYLGWKGARTKNWTTLRYYDACVICFLAYLGAMIFIMENFQIQVGAALTENSTLTQDSDENTGTILFPHMNLDSHEPVKSFFQVGITKAFVLYLQTRFQLFFPLNEALHRFLMDFEIQPWLAKTFNVTAWFYPQPLSNAPTYMRNFVDDTCSNQHLVNETQLTGYVPLHLDPTFRTCLRPILETSAIGASSIECILIALASLQCLQYVALISLKYIDPSAKIPQKKSIQKTNSFIHFLELILLFVGIAFLIVSGCIIYNIATRGDSSTVDSDYQIVEIATVSYCIIFGILLCTVTALGFATKLIRAQLIILVILSILLSVFVVVALLIQSSLEQLARNSLHANAWYESIVLVGYQHFLRLVESKRYPLLDDLVLQECQAQITSPLNDICKETLAERIAYYYLGSIVHTAYVVVAVVSILLCRNIWVVHFLPKFRKKIASVKSTKNADVHRIQNDLDVFGIKEATIPFHVAMEKYWESYPRSRANDTTLALARQQFTLEWHKVTGASSIHETDQLLTQSQFESIVRVLILKRLMGICGFEVSVSISRDGKKLFFKLTAPRKVIAQEAELRKYRLQFRDSIDPGPSFWTAKEVATENKVYDVQTARQKLGALYGRHLLTVAENQFYPDETMVQISRRINVHSREAMLKEMTLTDISETTGKHKTKSKKKNVRPLPAYIYAPFAPYFRKNRLQYLYRRHSTQLDLPTTDVAPSVFQAKDCFKLLNAILHDEIDTTRMTSNGMILGFSCLHGASRFEWTNLKSLSNAWLTYWRPRQLPGEPDPDKRYFLNFFCRIYPFRQPLHDVRSYFGEKIALYFLWLGFYAQWLTIPFFCSIIYLISRHGDYHSYIMIERKDGSMEYKLNDMFLGLTILCWAFIYAKCWQRKNFLSAVAWGMDGIQEDEPDRADFYGEEQINPITNETIRVFPKHLQIQLQIISFIAMGIFILFYSFGVLILFMFQLPLVHSFGSYWGMTLTSFLQVAHLRIHWYFTPKIVHWLNDRENYQRVSEYEHYLILKLFGFQCIHHFIPLFFVGFLKQSIFGCIHIENLSIPTSCLPEMENLLFFIFLWRLFSNLIEILYPIFIILLNRTFLFQPNRRYDLEYELSLDIYENTCEDYTNIIIQFGLFLLFIFPFPISPIFAFFESCIKIRIDGFKLSYMTRRPLPENGQDIGTWFTCILFLLRFSIITNFGFLFFTSSNFLNYSFQERFTFYLLSVAISLVIYESLWFLIPSKSKKLNIIMERHDFLRQKYFYSNDFNENNNKNFKNKNIKINKIIETLENYNLITKLNERVNLLEDFNELYQKNENYIEMIQKNHIPTDLNGMDAIREAVRRSTGLFSSNDDEISEWYFNSQMIQETLVLDRIPTMTSTYEITREFINDTEEEEFYIDEKDQNIADLL